MRTLDIELGFVEMIEVIGEPAEDGTTIGKKVYRLHSRKLLEGPFEEDGGIVSQKWTEWEMVPTVRMVQLTQGTEDG